MKLDKEGTKEGKLVDKSRETNRLQEHNRMFQSFETMEEICAYLEKRSEGWLAVHIDNIKHRAQELTESYPHLFYMRKTWRQVGQPELLYKK